MAPPSSSTQWHAGRRRRLQQLRPLSRTARAMHHPRASDVSWSLDLSKCLESEPLYDCALTKARQLIGYDRATIFTVSDGVAHLVAVHGVIGQPLTVNALHFTIHDDPIITYW